MVQKVCPQCDQQFTYQPRRGRQPKFCNASCYRDAYKSGGIYFAPRSAVSFPNCAECDAVFCLHRGINPGQADVCASCRRTRTNRRMREYLRVNQCHKKRRKHPIVCIECGADATSRTVDGKYCSLTCCAKANGRRGYAALPAGVSQTRHARRRALERDAFVEPVDRRLVFEADGYRCHLCGRKTLPTKKVPHPRAPTVDHIVPLAKGGKHERKNCRTACFRCNVTKCDGGGGEQLLLIG